MTAPTDLRELVLEAFGAAVASIHELASVQRNPNWSVRKPALPAAGVFDGPEVANPQDTAPPTLDIRMSVTVELWAIKPTVPEALSELNRLRGLVRRALGADPTLGGLAGDVLYAGCDQPEPLDLTAAESEASLQLNFTVVRPEAAYDPDSFV